MKDFKQLLPTPPKDGPPLPRVLGVRWPALPFAPQEQLGLSPPEKYIQGDVEISYVKKEVGNGSGTR